MQHHFARQTHRTWTPLSPGPPHRGGIAPRIGRKWPGLRGHDPKHRGGHPKTPFNLGE